MIFTSSFLEVSIVEVTSLRESITFRPNFAILLLRTGPSKYLLVVNNNFVFQPKQITYATKEVIFQCIFLVKQFQYPAIKPVLIDFIGRIAAQGANGRVFPYPMWAKVVSVITRALPGNGSPSDIVTFPVTTLEFCLISNTPFFVE